MKRYIRSSEFHGCEVSGSDDCWYIVRSDDPSIVVSGPYETEEEAESELRQSTKESDHDLALRAFVSYTDNMRGRFFDSKGRVCCRNRSILENYLTSLDKRIDVSLLRIGSDYDSESTYYFVY